MEEIPDAAEPAGPSMSETTRRIVAFMHKHGRAAAPAVISRSLDMPGPKVRTALKRMKDDPSVPVITLGHGAWIHADHAGDYTEAA